MISINARPSYWDRGHTREKYLHRLSARVRGEEVAEYLGGKFNAGTREKKVKVIAMSAVHYNYLKKELSNEITLIPHHHINFERQKRTRNKTLVGGIIGSPSKMVHDISDKIRDDLAKVGIEFTICFNSRTRQEMISYYKSIDFPVNWYLDIYKRDSFYRHTAKIINAASFGIPTLAQPISGYSEVEGFYIPIETVDDIVREAKKLKDEDCYNQWSEKLLKEAKKYHISKTAKLYQNL